LFIIKQTTKNKNQSKSATCKIVGKLGKVAATSSLPIGKLKSTFEEF
jgi:hypothetical protein